MTLFDESYEEDESVRLIGISVSDFENEEVLLKQVSLFDESSQENINEILSELNHQLGTKGFVRASTLLEKEK